MTTPPPRPTVRPGRLVLWRAAARMFAAHPLAGVGPDNFRLAYGRYAGLAGADPRTHSNNMYLEMLAGGGLLVAGAFAWLLWRSARACAALVSRAAGGRRLRPDRARAWRRRCSRSRCTRSSIRSSASRRPTCCSR